MLKRQKTNPTHFPVDDTAEASLVKPTLMIRQNQSDRSAAGSTIANYRDDVPPDRDCLTRQTVGSSLGAAPSLSDDTIINGHLCSHNNSIQRSVHRLNSKQPLYCSARSFQTIYVLHQSKDAQVSPVGSFVAPRSGQPTSCSNGGSKVIGCTYEGKMPAPSCQTNNCRP